LKLKKPEGPVLTGEEDEENISQVKGKLYEFVKDEKGNVNWKERGVGVAKLNLNPKNKRARLVMREKHTFRLILNTAIWPQMPISKVSAKSITFTAINLVVDDKKVIPYSIKTATPEDTNTLFSDINKYKGESSQATPTKQTSSNLEISSNTTDQITEGSKEQKVSEKEPIEDQEKNSDSENKENTVQTEKKIT